MQFNISNILQQYYHKYFSKDQDEEFNNTTRKREEEGSEPKQFFAQTSAAKKLKKYLNKYDSSFTLAFKVSSKRGKLTNSLRKKLEQFSAPHAHHHHDTVHVEIQGEDGIRLLDILNNTTDIEVEFEAIGRPFSQIEFERRESSISTDADEGYFTNEETLAWMTKLQTQYPQYAKVLDLSKIPGGKKTHQGRSIHALKLSKGVGDTVADKPAILIASQHHARELNSAVMSLYAMQRILKGVKQGKEQFVDLLENYEVYIVPTVNPDGVDIVWNENNMHRKNGRENEDGSVGVDNNRNYGFLHGKCGSSSEPSSQIFKGPRANSEPETQTMIALGKLIRPSIYLDFHSSGQEVLTLYPPCATIDDSVKDLGEVYADDLRNKMGYAIRPPSASGEAPHDFWSKGTMAFLIEIGRSFQPQFYKTVAEEQRVWPGVFHVLTTWKPGVLGKITSLSGKPVEAEITVKPMIFFHDEKSFSRAADGRYNVWLPKGSYRLEIKAPGYKNKQVDIRIDAYNQARTLDIQLEPVQNQIAAA